MTIRATLVGSLTPKGISKGVHVGQGSPPLWGDPSATHGHTTAGPAATSGEKRAAQLIPARRPPQATHGTCRAVVFRTGQPWPPPWAPADGGPPHRRPVGLPCLGETLGRPPHHQVTVVPPRPHAAASGKKSAPPN